ncbi:OsmC family protein [Lysobacter korlensis]|uniref:OsmC family protein n=1 Tax=Lysobacter korlensis TaxID=553636 RepID=A0ABV6S221_9GAMM
MSADRTDSVGLIDGARLRESLETITRQVESDDSAGRMRPWVSASLERDVTAVATFEQYGRVFEFRSDEAVARGGHDSAPSPMRYLLSSIAFCTLGWIAKTWAAHDVPVTSLRTTVRTSLDMRGEHRVGSAEAHPPWFVVEVDIDDDARPGDSIAMLREAVARCPVTALVDRAVPVHLVLIQRGKMALDTRPEELRTEHAEEQTR